VPERTRTEKYLSALQRLFQRRLQGACGNSADLQLPIGRVKLTIGASLRGVFACASACSALMRSRAGWSCSVGASSASMATLR